MRERFERFDKYMQSKGLNDNQVTIQCDLSQGLLGQARTGKSDLGKKTIDKILNVYQDLNRVWLLTGEGEMLTDQAEKPAPQQTADYRLVPLINIDSVGGIHSDNLLTPSEQYIIRMLPFAEARTGDVAIIQSGTSMYPTIPPGSALLIREVVDWKEYFGYGGIYVIWLKDGRRITKEIRRYDADPKNYVWCVSYNPDVADEELPKSMIRAVWKVVKYTADFGW